MPDMPLVGLVWPARSALVSVCAILLQHPGSAQVVPNRFDLPLFEASGKIPVEPSAHTGVQEQLVVGVCRPGKLRRTHVFRDSARNPA